ncbi:MAG: hypothetical protein H6918_04845 [Sphingomonadaceae bacterium]|nr:hypothetical protein [Sphingomonadaceae bacterium]
MAGVSASEHSSGGERPRHYWWKVGFAILVVQLVYWLLIAPISQQAPLGQFNRVEAVNVAELEEPTLDAVRALPADAWREEEIFWYGCCDQQYYVFRYTIPLDREPEADLGLIAGFGADNSHIWINGYPLVDTGTLSDPGSYDKWVRGVLRVSRAMVKQGDNEVIAITARHGGGYTDLYPQTWGDYASMRAATAKRSFFVNDFRIATMIFVGFVGLLALVLVPFSRNRAFSGWLAVLGGSLALRIAYLRWEEPTLSPENMRLFYFLVTNLAALAWFNFLDSWSEKAAWPLARKAMTMLFAAIMALIAWRLHADLPSGYDLADEATNAFMMLSGMLTAALFFWRLWRWPTPRYLEIGIFTLGVVAVTMDAANQFLSEWVSGSNMQFALPLLVFGLVAAILGRNFRLYESMESFNAELNRKLEDSRAEIELRYAELREAQRARDLAQDRQRILRDMHDGIGSQLTGLLVQARANNLEPHEMQQGIEASLHDLRLVVDSLDAEHASLISAMATLKPRMARQLDAAGIVLDWQMEPPEDARFTSGDILQFGRIIQEAVTNIIRHSRATKARIIMGRMETDATQLELLIEDNGEGLDLAAGGRSGHGLHNLTHRAEALGGNLDFGQGLQGFYVKVTCPIPT